MPYKIVQTIKNGKEHLSICPSKWEADNILYWPKNNAESLSQKEFSLPGSDWSEINCIVEKTNIPDYDEAKEQLNSILGNAQIDEEDDKSLVIKDLLKHGNVFVRQGDGTLTTVINTPPHNNQTNNDSDSEDNVHSNEDYSETDDIKKLSKFERILYNQKILFENQNIMLENQKQIMLALKKISTKLGNIDTGDELPQTEIMASIQGEKQIKFSQKPIVKLEELQYLEKELANDAMKENYKKKYSIFCSRGKGLNCAYQLIDIFFTREFLTQCSWSGCTRGSGMKISIKTFQRFLNFFFELIHECDPTYTVQDNHSFFKSILKNATKRTYAKFQRISTSRKRQRRTATTENLKEFSEVNNATLDINEKIFTQHESNKSVTDCVIPTDASTSDDDKVSKSVKITTGDNKDTKNATLTFNVILKVD